MATLVKSPPKNKGGKKQQREKTGTQPQQPFKRFTRRFLYRLRHPVDTAWGWLSAVRTAIFLISSIAAICLIGIYIVQVPGEVLDDPVAYAAWVQQNELPRYGALTPIYDWLQFFHIFSSWYFMFLLTVLALSIVVCTLNRAPAIWQNFRHPLLRRSNNFYQNALERGEFAHPDAVEWTRAALRKRRYRVRSLVEVKEDGSSASPAGRGQAVAPTMDESGEALPRFIASPAGRGQAVVPTMDGPDEPISRGIVGATACPRPAGSEVTYLYASKNTWATLSTFVFHAALVTLLMAGVLSLWHGFAPNSPARSFLPGPIVSLSDSLAGFSFDQALPDGQSAVVYARGTPHNISFRANSFKATFDPQTGLPTDYVTDLSVYQDGELVAHSDHLRVNDPLSYNGVVFHQSSLIPSVNITINDAGGCIMCDEPIVLDSTATTPSGLQVDYADGIPISGTNLTMSVLFAHIPSVQLAQVQHPLLLISIGTPGTSPNQDKVLLRLQPGQSGQSFDKQWKVTLNTASEATVLLVTRDTGSVLVWPTAVILILSLCVTFYFPQRRIWVRIDGQRVQMAALREHFTNIRTDLLGMARDASISTH